MILRAVADTDAETEEVEEADGERDGDKRANKDAWVMDSLVPSAGEIEERRARGDCWEEERVRSEKQPFEQSLCGSVTNKTVSLHLS